jgi:hypothetical protein
MRSGRSTFVALVLLAGVAVAIGGLWTAYSPRHSAQVKEEIDALRKSQAATRPKTAAASSPALCHSLRVTNTGTVSDDDLGELSGLVASRRTPHLFWANEDSGASATLHALRENGSLAGSWNLPGAEAVDWEDIAAGPSPSGPVLYAADIGDNLSKRDSISIYRVPEPASAVGGGNTAPAQRLELHYPDGAHDAETLLVDPKRGTLIVVTKAIAGGAAYAVNAPLPFGGTATLRKIGPVNVPLATAGDVSSDGKIIAVRGYFSLSIWKRRGNESISTTLKRSPCVSPTGLSDGQGEAIALSKSGSAAWTTAEGDHPPIKELRAK